MAVNVHKYIHNPIKYLSNLSRFAFCRNEFVFILLITLFLGGPTSVHGVDRQFRSELLPFKKLAGHVPFQENRSIISDLLLVLPNKLTTRTVGPAF